VDRLGLVDVTQTMTHIALLRGINVGGKNKLPMRDLAAMFEDVGCTNVRTYIQSGNVLFDAPASQIRRLPACICERIRKDFGYNVPVIMRSADELAATVRSNPFAKKGADEKLLHVMFLADPPKPALVRQLDAHRSPPDEFRVKGREIYLYLPNGVAKTKLTNAYFDSKLATISTSRNWRTVNKLLELAKSA
jgi:uncharacterized protein (DUF1697 family)